MNIKTDEEKLQLLLDLAKKLWPEVEWKRHSWYQTTGLPPHHVWLGLHGELRQ